MSAIVAFYEEVGVKEVLSDMRTFCEQCEFLITKTKREASSRILVIFTGQNVNAFGVRKADA